MRIFTGGLLTALVFSVGSIASAQDVPIAVAKSGNSYHVAACQAPVVGLAARCYARIVSDRFGKLLTHQSPPISGKTPANLRDAYKITTDGDSHTVIAIVDAFGYDNAESDLAVYRAQWGLPPCTTKNGCFKKLNQKGQQKNYPAQNIGWAQESALDLDMASAMCPKCTIYLVEANTNSFKNLGQAVNTAAAMGAHVISNSYGGGESKRIKDFEQYYNHPGVAVTASTGDDGYGVQAPADMPEVIAVGGTHLVPDGSKRGWSETVWQGAGSGCSKVFAKPVWQLDSGCKKRTVGDVSAVADPATGVAVYAPNSQGVGTWLVFGGTSVSAPLVGGILANKGGIVDAASTIYAAPAALFDVTSGNNGTCDPAYLCTGGAGYDGPTGLGTPNGTGAFGN